MRSKNRKVRALKELKRDVPLVNIRRAIDQLYDIPHKQMAAMLHVSRPNITSHINGFRNNPETQSGIAAIWNVPKEEIFKNE